ncbi:hypothetical protein AAFC00_001536 [Neodothiora populina]|uniref:Serine peptidase n=1 Tax=Neodothiora populina TaxID=2781224 RepID=A0ABR3PPD9_9PEZI
MQLLKVAASLALLLTASPALAGKPDKSGTRDFAKRQWKSHMHLQGWERHPVFHSNATTGNATFEQYIDHKNPDLGTFSQLYFWSTEFWGGPGSPIVIFTPGEVAASGYTGYLTNRTTTGVVAQKIGAAVIIVEHRYWGQSSPVDVLSTKNMQYLTLENSISDLNHFAQTVRLPFDPRRASRPQKAPWVLMGGSYSGALSAWTASTQPGTFWAYHASSAPVQAISDYWQYFVPVQEGMPQNCSKDVSLVVDHVDAVFHNGTADEQYALKAMFGLGDLEHYDDFAAALENGPWLWQGNQFYLNSGFFYFCDAVENATPNGTVPGAEGVGLEKALAGYASWFNTTMLPGFCASYGYADWQGQYSIGCFDTYNASSPQYTDMSLSNGFDRQWTWFLCNEPFGYWQDGAPSDRPSIVSRLVDAQYWIRQCPLSFPPEDGYTFGIAKGETEDEVNSYTKGWDIAHPRLLYVNGDYDPWREASVSSEFRDGGKLASTADHPVVIVPGGFHTSDLLTRNAQSNAGAATAIDAVVAQLKAWVDEFPKK